MAGWLSGRLKFAVAVAVGAVLMSCQPFSDADQKEIQSLAVQMNASFAEVRKEIETLKQVTKKILDDPESSKGLFDDSRYKFTETRVYYTPVDDGQCEVWASGHVPIGAGEKKKVKILEHLCPDLETIYNRSGFVDNIYFTTYDSIVMGYPHADMNAYMKPGLDLTKVWVTYWAADEKANPDRKTLWVNPYIDALGRGYMTSIITPVYRDDFLEGTLGIDITVDLISDKYISLSKKNLMIVTGRTIPVAMNKNSFKILNIKGLEKYNYLKKEAENKSISSSLMMTKNPSKEIRSIAQWILSPEKKARLKVSGRTYTFLKEDLPEIGWFLVEFKEK